MYCIQPVRAISLSDDERRYANNDRYILDVGQSEDWFALQMAMLPCLLGYSHIAARLSTEQDPNAPKGANRYRQWIDNYVAEDYVEAVRRGCGTSHCHVREAS